MNETQPEKKLTTSQRWQRSVSDVINTYKQRLAIAKKLGPQIDSLSFEANVDFCVGYIDFNYLSHEYTVEVIKVFGGKWDKEYLENSIHYTRKEEIAPGYQLRVYMGKPPASCKVVECGEEFVPGYTRKKYKVVCNEGNEGSELATQPNEEVKS